MTDARREPIDISVVLPIFNERGHVHDEIERIHKGLADSQYSYEIIVIDDGSSDGSGDDLEGVEGIRLIRFLHNRGSGFARRVGTEEARGSVVVWTDADMTYPNDQIAGLVDELPGHDQVVGARTSEQGTKKAVRVPAKWFIRTLASFLTGTKIPDLNSGFRAFRRDVALQYLSLLPAGFSCVTTLTMAFLANGYSVKYIPIDYARRAGTSKFHWWSDTRRFATQVIRMTMLYNPMRVFMPLGFVVFLTGVGKVVYDLITKDFRLGTNTLALLLAAAALFIVGMLADLIVQLNKHRGAVHPAGRPKRS